MWAVKLEAKTSEEKGVKGEQDEPGSEQTAW